VLSETKRLLRFLYTHAVKIALVCGFSIQKRESNFFFESKSRGCWWLELEI
jgi:hypothetical protein